MHEISPHTWMAFAAHGKATRGRPSVCLPVRQTNRRTERRTDRRTDRQKWRQQYFCRRGRGWKIIKNTSIRFIWGRRSKYATSRVKELVDDIQRRYKVCHTGQTIKTGGDRMIPTQHSQYHQWSWFLMPRFPPSPEHHHSWYWLCRIGKFFFTRERIQLPVSRQCGGMMWFEDTLLCFLWKI